ncbi:MAG: dipeptidase [Bacteroidales bacterium]|nr:dipeptidase [Bacteroidales bacterium]
MKIILSLVCFVIVFIFSGFSQNNQEKKLIKKANRIHEEVLTIDSHVDTPMRLIRDGFDISKRNDPDESRSKVDFPRMKEGNLDGIFFAVFLGQGERTKEGNKKAKEKTLKIFEAIHKSVQDNPEMAEIALTPDDAHRIEKNGKRAIFIGIENGYPIGNDLSSIKEYYDLGARYITLCHTKNNDICDSSTDTIEHHGLSKFGEDVIRKMNDLGMMIDVSHISDEAFYDVIEISKSPIIASHSCARAICDNPRNLDDKMLEKLAKNGGVIQMCILSDYVEEPEPNLERDAAQEAVRTKYKGFVDLSDEEMKNARKDWYAIDKKYPRKLTNVSRVVDHIDHIVEVAGINHVGIGTDFDGGGGVEGCYDVSEMGNITLELVKRGYTKKEIEKIWGGNLMRVLKVVENNASNNSASI